MTDISFPKQDEVLILLKEKSQSYNITFAYEIKKKPRKLGQNLVLHRIFEEENKYNFIFSIAYLCI